nr:FecR family protein [Akkermansiaceae bacterium]
MKPEPTPPLASLLAKLVDHGLDEAEHAKLEEILTKNPAARDYYRLYLATHLDLNEVVADLGFAPSPRPGWLRRFQLPLAMAALIPLAVGIILWGPWRDTRREPGAEVLAITSASQGVKWSLATQPSAGLKLHAGRIRLASGKLSMTLRGGQIATFAAPSEFQLIDETEIFLHQGNASLRITGDPTPFTIRVPHGEVVDLGTEFSVNVAADGTADVWVFEGKAMVSLTSGSSKREQQSLIAGQSVRIAQSLAPSPSTATDFVRPLLEAAPTDPPNAIIADFSADFPASNLGSGQPFSGSEKPADGWAFLWNPTGTLGDASLYQALLPNTVNTFPAADGGGIFPMFTKLGDVAFNSIAQEHFQYGRIAKTSIHPGRYITGKDYRAIIAYTIQADEAGSIRIANSSLAKHRV